MSHSPIAIIQRVKDGAKQLLPDVVFLSLLHRKHIGRFPNLSRPCTFNEKILRRSLRPDPKYGELADKLAVRNYVSAKVGDKHLVPLIAAPNVFTRALFDSLPTSFVMKANHGSSFVEVVRDKSQETFENLQCLGNRWINTDFYRNAREQHYRDIQPRVFFEELLLDGRGQIPADYKVHCFADPPRPPVMFILLISDRFGNETRGDVFDARWNHLDIEFSPYTRSIIPPPPPDHLESMLTLAASLAEGFDYVRVDLYAPGNDLYFGELTFTPGAGTMRIRPEAIDVEWGRLMR